MLFNFDQANQQLNITISTSLAGGNLEQLDSPTWKEGVAGVLTDYNLFMGSYRPQDGSNAH